MDDRTKAKVAREWRELGFFYDRLDDPRTWVLQGSRDGLLELSKLLRSYTMDPVNASISEHAHYGPYWYLKITTWPETEITEDGIAGPLPQLRALGDRIAVLLEKARIGDTFDVGADFAPNGPFGIRLIVREPDFDPAAEDGSLRR